MAAERLSRTADERAPRAALHTLFRELVMKDVLNRLFDHLVWADSVAQAEVEAIDADHPAAMRALAIYSHLAAVEHTWLSRLIGQEPSVALWPLLSLDAAARLASATGAQFREYIAAMTPGAENVLVTYHNSSRREFTNRVVDILMHVALHGSYHRGQLALLARRSGRQPAVTEYIAFMRELQAATE